MNKRHWSLLLVILVVSIGVLWLNRSKPDHSRRPESAAPVGLESKPAAPPTATVVAPGAGSAPAPVPASPSWRDKISPLPPPVAPPQPVGMPHAEQVRQLEKIALDIRHFAQRFGGNPVGTNGEIVQAMRGGNQARANYLAAPEYRLNDHGEIIDTWGTPYFFHANSGSQMEIRSAGPDKVLWTPDDIIER